MSYFIKRQASHDVLLRDIPLSPISSQNSTIN